MNQSLIKGLIFVYMMSGTGELNMAFLMKQLSILLLIQIGIIPVFAQSLLDSNKNWSFHFQLTAINQSHPAFNAKYTGNNSLSNQAEHQKLSVTSTLFTGRKLWKNASIYFNPEIAGGAGISSAKGIAGFTNGETFRIGSADPKLYIARLYLRQHISLQKNAVEKIEDAANQVAETIPANRITLTAGKICLADFFDKNTCSHDPRTQFLNWSLMSNAAWDYPADTRGYTQGLVAEMIHPNWAIRLASVLVPRKANGLQLDYKITKAHSETIEIEKSWQAARPGVVRLLVFRNATQAPTYATTLHDAINGDSSSVDVYSGVKEWKKYGGVKYGLGINAEQEISSAGGVFFKASYNDGKTATWAFTEIDESASAGINIKGAEWKRPGDNIGVAQVVNGISKEHQQFLNRGFYGFIIGDGKLNYSTECITETYYQAQISTAFSLSFDYQFVLHPAYNKDRGPVNVFAFRGHIAL
jgi:high affinity Mn2+ porin